MKGRKGREAKGKQREGLGTMPSYECPCYGLQPWDFGSSQGLRLGASSEKIEIHAGCS